MITLSIPDMTCGHCRAAVEAALRPLPGVTGVAVDLPARKAEVTGTAAAADLIAALDSIGFPAELRAPGSQ